MMMMIDDGDDVAFLFLGGSKIQFHSNNTIVEASEISMSFWH
jgi:hypothetical protein